MPRQIDLFPQNLQVSNNPNNQLGFTQEQLSNLNAQIPIALEKAEVAFINSVLSAIDQATGWDLLSFAQQAENGLTYTGNLATDLWNYLVGTNTTANDAWNNWVTTLENTEQATIADFTEWLNNTESNAAAAWTQIENFIATGDWSDLSAAWNDLLTGIFGSATSASLLSYIPASAVVNTTQNAQPVSNFPDAQSVSGGDGWSWDGTVSFGGSGGSVKAAANGTLMALRGVIAAVQPGQVVTPSAEIQWSGLAAAGGTSPMQLQLIPYSGTAQPGTPGTPVVCAKITSPAASGSWTTPTPVTGSGVTAGAYTVPSSGVGFVQLRLVVTADATAGNVWWASCTDNISGGFLATLENDLTTLQDNSTASTAAFATFLQAVQTAITGYTNWSTFITAVESAWNTYSTTESGLISADIFTIQNFFNTALGINTSTGLMAASNVSSATGLSTLQADWNAWITNIETTWNNLWGVTTVSSGQKVSPGSVANVLGGSNLGADVLAVHTTAVNGSTWVTRMINDWQVIGDFFHTTYQLGTPSDAPGLIYTGGGLGNGKMTWYGAWNDYLVLIGLANTVTTPTQTAADVGTSIQANTASATTAGTNASIAIAANQATNDAIVSATTGSTVTGSTTSQVTTGLTNIPASNVVGVAPANVAFGAKGAGNLQTGAASTLSVSESHTIAAGDLGVLVTLSYEAAAASTWTSSVTYGGVAMTQVGSPLKSSSTTGGFSAYLEMWWLPAPASGTQTVAASVTRATGSGNIIGVAAESMSYTASKLGSITPNSGGGGTSLSMTQASATGRMVVGAFAAIEVQSAGTNIALSAYNQTSRYNQSGTGTAGGWGVVTGDAAGASSLTFSATSNNTIQGYVGYTVELKN